MKAHDITMFDDYVEFDSIKLKVDPVNRKCPVKHDNVMAIFFEEQPIMWLLLKEKIENKLQELGHVKEAVDFLDVGCGSGFWGVMLRKHFNCSVIALDKLERAVRLCRENAKLNNVTLHVVHSTYEQWAQGHSKAKIIGLYPPYHIYPPATEDMIPFHARGGSNGTEEFYSQLKISSDVLVEDGMVIFNMMSIGDEAGPEYVKRYKELLGRNASLSYTNIFQPLDTSYFLRKLYGRNHMEFQVRIAQGFPKIYYTIGTITNDNRGQVTCEPLKIDLTTRSWADRIALHKEINSHVSL